MGTDSDRARMAREAAAAVAWRDSGVVALKVTEYMGMLHAYMLTLTNYLGTDPARGLAALTKEDWPALWARLDHKHTSFVCDVLVAIIGALIQGGL